MRTTIIPAQITTVEDKIIGSFTMPQLVMLMIPVLWTTLVYALFPVPMHITWYKIPVVLLVVIVSVVLSLRIKGKVMIQWLEVILRYNLRPQYYVFNKNTMYLRDAPIQETKQLAPKKVKAKPEIAIPAKTFNLKDLKELEPFI